MSSVISNFNVPTGECRLNLILGCKRTTIGGGKTRFHGFAKAHFFYHVVPGSVGRKLIGEFV